MATRPQPITFRLPADAHETLQEQAKSNGKRPNTFAKELVLQGLTGSTEQQLAHLATQLEQLAAETAAQAEHTAELQAELQQIRTQLSKALPPLVDALKNLPNRLAPKVNETTEKLRRDVAAAMAGLLYKLTDMSPAAAKKWVKETFRP